MSKTFREWLEYEHGEQDKFVLVSRVIEEFSRRFRLGSMDNPIEPSAVVWFEIVEERGEEQIGE